MSRVPYVASVFNSHKAGAGQRQARHGYMLHSSPSSRLFLEHLPVAQRCQRRLVIESFCLCVCSTPGFKLLQIWRPTPSPFPPTK